MHHRILSLALLAGLAMAADRAATVAVELPTPVLHALGQPPGADEPGILATIDGDGAAREVFLPVMADTSLWRENRKPSGGGNDLTLRDDRWSQGLLRCDLSALPAGGAVRSARLRLRITGCEKPGQPGRIMLHRLLVPWQESATWFQPDPAATATWDGLKPGRDFTAEPLVTIDLPQPAKGATLLVPGLEQQVEAWRREPATNHGLLVLVGGKVLQVGIAARERGLARNRVQLGGEGRIRVELDRELFARLAPDAALIAGLVLRIALDRGKDAPLPAGHLELRLTPEGAVQSRADATAPDADGWLELDATAALGAGGGTCTVGATAPIALAWMKDAKRQPRLVATLRRQPAVELFPAPTPIRDGVFCTARDGHLWYGDQRLRLWGTLGFGSKERLRKMGFNAYRFWAGEKRFYTEASGRAGRFASTTQGDGSPLDEHDREVALLKGMDVFIMDTALMLGWMPGVLADGSFLAEGDDWPAWRAAMQAIKDPEGIVSALVLFDPRLRSLRLRHAENYLRHRNPYTGRTYGEEEAIAIHELANERWVVGKMLNDGFDKLGPYFRERLRLRWNAWLQERHRDDATLAAAWGGKPADGTIAARDLQLAPTGGARAKDRARADDLARFLLDLSEDWRRTFTAHCRAQAPAGRGVAVTPFSADTQYRPDLTWTYDNSRAEVQNFGMYFWDMGSQLAKPPSLYVMDSTTVAGRATVIYETNRGRPSAYRSEYPYIAAAFAAWQDWDAVFFHYWGGPRDGTPDERWLLEDMLPPHPHHFWNAVHHSADPVMCASMALAGRAFLAAALAPAPDPAICTVGKQALLRNGAVNAGPTAFTRGCRLRFEPEGDFATRLPGDNVMPTVAVDSGTEIRWDWPNARLIVDTPTVKFLVGRTAPHRFRDGITVSGFDRPFTAFALVAADGRRLVDGCARAWIGTTADARNTGFVFDATRNCDGPVHQAQAVVAAGRAPAIVDRPGWTLSFPVRLDARFTPYDFALRAGVPVAMNSQTLRWRERDLWLGVLDIASRGAAAEPELDAVRTELSTGMVGDGPATDPNRAAIPHPLPGLSWGDNAPQALRTLRESPLGLDRTTLTGAVADTERAVAVRGVADFHGGTADLELRFRAGRMAAVVATFTRPPTWIEAVAAMERAYGRPDQRRDGTQFEGSHARWRDVRGMAVAVEETQGVLVMRWEVLR